MPLNSGNGHDTNYGYSLDVTCIGGNDVIKSGNDNDINNGGGRNDTLKGGKGDVHSLVTAVQTNSIVGRELIR